MVGSLHARAFAPRVFYARSCFGVPLWAGRCRLPALALLCARFRNRLFEPPACAIERISPAYYVELRALEIAKEDLELSTSRAHYRPPINPPKLPWPFRWPVPAPAPTAATTSPMPPMDPRSSLDLWI